jgi:hypothetical protein
MTGRSLPKHGLLFLALGHAGCVPPLLGSARNEAEQIALAICESHEACGFGVALDEMPDHDHYRGVDDCLKHETPVWTSVFRQHRADDCTPDAGSVEFCVATFEVGCDDGEPNEYEMLGLYVDCLNALGASCE